MGVKEIDVPESELTFAPAAPEIDSGEDGRDRKISGDDNDSDKDPRKLTRKFVVLHGGKVKEKPDKHVRGEDRGHEDDGEGYQENEFGVLRPAKPDRRNEIREAEVKEEIEEGVTTYSRTFTLNSDARPRTSDLLVVRDTLVTPSTELNGKKNSCGGLHATIRVTLREGETTVLNGGRIPINEKKGSR